MTDSTAVRAVQRLRVLWRRAVASSLLVRSLQRLEGQADDTFEGSTLAGVWKTIGRWIRGSWLYRWLTAEPDPEVVVIDLRETYTVGPIIAVLGRVGGVVARWWSGTTTRGVLGRTADALRREPIRVVSLALVAAFVAEFALALLSGIPSWPGLVARGALLLLAALGTRVTTPWETLRDSRTIRGLRAVLEPPEPPDRLDRSDDPDDRESDQKGTATDDR